MDSPDAAGAEPARGRLARPWPCPCLSKLPLNSRFERSEPLSDEAGPDLTGDGVWAAGRERGLLRTAAQRPGTRPAVPREILTLRRER
jgi:hypothetical protein